MRYIWYQDIRQIREHSYTNINSWTFIYEYKHILILMCHAIHMIPRHSTNSRYVHIRISITHTIDIRQIRQHFSDTHGIRPEEDWVKFIHNHYWILGHLLNLSLSHALARARSPPVSRALSFTLSLSLSLSLSPHQHELGKIGCGWFRNSFFLDEKSFFAWNFQPHRHIAILVFVKFEGIRVLEQIGGLYIYKYTHVFWICTYIYTHAHVYIYI